jgi:YbbR domain-containing protein
MKRRSSDSRIVGWFRAAFTENLGLKTVCMFLALVLTSYQRSQEDEKTRTIEFTLDNQLPPASAARELMTPLPPSVKVTVQGSSSALDELASSFPRVELDLRAGNQQLIEFTPAQFEVPPRVAVKVIEPAQLELEWQDVITRSVRVQSSVTGQVADAFDVQAVSVEPEQVDLRGPQSLVKVAQFVRVAPFDVTGLTDGVYTRQLALDPPPSRTNYSGAVSAAVTVEVKRRLFATPFRGRPVEVVGIAGARATPAKVDVTVKGPPEVVKALEDSLVVPRVDVTGVDTRSHGSKVVKVTVDLSGAEAEVQPPTVKVTW